MNSSTRIAVIKGLLVFFICLFFMWGGWNVYEYFSLAKPLAEVQASNEEFKNIGVEVKYQRFMDNKVIVFNITKVPDPTKLVVFEFFIEFAEKMYERQFSQVVLQYRGKTRFLLEGRNFSGLGVRAQLEPVDNIALDFPPMVTNIEGLPVYKTPYGEEQWVIQKKLKNFRELLFEWYVNDWLVEAKKKGTKLTVTKKTSGPEDPNAAGTPGGEEIPEIDVDLEVPTDAGTPETVESPESPEDEPIGEPTGKSVEPSDAPIVEPEQI